MGTKLSKKSVPHSREFTVQEGRQMYKNKCHKYKWSNGSLHSILQNPLEPGSFRNGFPRIPEMSHKMSKVICMNKFWER